MRLLRPCSRSSAIPRTSPGFAQVDDGVRVTAQVEYEIAEAILRRLPEAAITRITERDLVLALENAKFTIEASLPQHVPHEDALRIA